MHRIYIPPEYISDTEILFPIEQGNRVSKVLRLKSGDSVTVFNGQGKDYLVILDHIKKQGVRGIIESMEVINRDPGLEIILLQGLPKFEKMELIIQKATELGVSRIIPIITDRTIPRLTAEKAQKRISRWQKIAISAAEQSGRTSIPSISAIQRFGEGLIAIKSSELKLFLWEEEKKITLKSILRNQKKFSSIAFFIGPEGGFTQTEAESAKQAGATVVSLGSRLLRTETAAITVLSILLYEFDNINDIIIWN